MVHPARATYDAQVQARQQAFLAAYGTLGNQTEAAFVIGVHRETVRCWLRDDDFSFRERFQEAQEVFADYLEQMARKKVERMDSKDNLLHMMLLNGNRPTKYRPTQQQNGGNVTITQIIINPPRDRAVVTKAASYQVLPSADDGANAPSQDLDATEDSSEDYA